MNTIIYIEYCSRSEVAGVYSRDLISTVPRLGLSVQHLLTHGLLIDVGTWFFNMRLVTLYRVIATVCVLVADHGVRGKKNDDDDDDKKTVTVTQTTAQTLTTTSVRIEATPVAVPNISPSAPPPAIPAPTSGPSTQQSTPNSNDGNSTMQAAGPPAAAENPATGGEMTPAMNQGASPPRPGNSSAQAGSPSAAAQVEAPSANQTPNRAPTVAAVQAQGMGMGMEIDPAAGDLLGGNPPSKNIDLPITIVFLLLFLTGAFTHISIYRANAKRGHKFLLSDLMFDFCMIRSVTCIFRITWIFSQLRGVILLAQIFFNGG